MPEIRFTPDEAAQLIAEACMYRYGATVDIVTVYNEDEPVLYTEVGVNVISGGVISGRSPRKLGTDLDVTKTLDRRQAALAASLTQRKDTLSNSLNNLSKEIQAVTETVAEPIEETQQPTQPAPIPQPVAEPVGLAELQEELNSKLEVPELTPNTQTTGAADAIGPEFLETQQAANKSGAVGTGTLRPIVR